MPFYWTPPPLPPVLPVQEQVRKQPVLGDFGDEITVIGKVQELDIVRFVATYSDGVTAKFGPTVVFADRLEVHQAESDQYAIARGNVRLEDPEGVLKADYFIFWYGPKKGPDGQFAVADRVELQMNGVTMKAESAILKEGRWEFLNVEGTNCKRPIPLYYLRSKKVVIVPGKEGTLYKPRISVLGQDLGNLPTRHFSLDSRNPGLQIPSVGYKAGAGFGLSWSSGLLLDDQSIVLGNFSSFPRDYPSYSASYARSFLSADVTDAQIVARSDLIERFSWSYFDNIRITHPFNTARSVTGRLRNAVTAQSVWNTGSSARLERESFSKAIDLTYERSGPVGPLGFYLQGRAQSVREGNNDFVQRGVLNLTLQAPPLTLAKGLQTDVRADLFGVASGNNQFGWARGQAGLIYQPIPQLTFGGALVTAGESGRPDFIADRLYSKHAAHFRADVNLGPTKLSYLAKYDFDRKQWYDKEYSISQVVGCLEPFIVRREFPSDYALGLRFRLDDFLGVLQRRKQVRTKPVEPQTISALPKKS